MPESHRLLCLIYTLLPDPGSAALRNFSQVDLISRYFDKTIVLTNTAGRPPFGVSIRTEKIDARDYRQLKKNGKSGFGENWKKRKIGRFFIKLINTLPFNLIIGEGGFFYIIRSFRRGGKLIRQEGITHIYSSYRPMADHFTAWLLKRRYPALRWIADFRDLAVEPHYRQQFLPGWHHRIYKKIFRRAEVLTTVSPGLVNQLKKYNTEVIAIPNGIKKGHSFSEKIGSQFFTIAYTGSMFLEERNVIPLLKVIKGMIARGRIDRNKCRIQYAGKDGLIWETLADEWHLEDIILNFGLLSRERTEALQADACVNLLLTISSHKLQGVLTGKYIEYLQAGSPILAIVKNQNDPLLADELKRFNAGISVSDQDMDLPLIEAFLLDKYHYWLKNGCNERSSLQDEILQHYDPDRLISALENYI